MGHCIFRSDCALFPVIQVSHSGVRHHLAFSLLSYSNCWLFIAFKIIFNASLSFLSPLSRISYIFYSEVYFPQSPLTGHFNKVSCQYMASTEQFLTQKKQTQCLPSISNNLFPPKCYLHNSQLNVQISSAKGT